jgi:hypothetical protein
MSTNNFEMIFKNLDFASIFHMWIVVTYKAPPILNLKKITWEKENKQVKRLNNSTIVKNSLRAKYKIYWLDYDSANNINKFLNKDQKALSIISSLENSVTRVELLDNRYQKILDLGEEIRNYKTSKLSKDINNDILKEFNIEFTELEQFSNNLVDYANKTDILIRNLKDIPTN